MSNPSDGFSASKTMIPHWDGKAKTYALYRSQYGGVAVFTECGDALDPALMRDMPTKPEYLTIKNRDTTASPWSDDEKRRMALYVANTKMSAIFVLGQSKNHAVRVLDQTKTDDYPHGFVWKALETLDASNKPNDMTAEIELENALERVNFGQADDYYANIVDVCARFDRPASDLLKLKVMTKKVQSSTYMTFISTQLKATTPDFHRACMEIAELQRLCKVTATSGGKKSDGPGKEVALNDTEKSGGNGGKKCDHCGKTGHLKADCRSRKDALKKQGDCPECGKPTHLEKECWKKHPEKAPKWFGKKKSESANANVEVVLAALCDEEQDFA